MSPHHLVEEIGRRLGVALVPDDAGMARLMIDSTLAVDFELDDANDRLFVRGTIGLQAAGPQREALAVDVPLVEQIRRTWSRPARASSRTSCASSSRR